MTSEFVIATKYLWSSSQSGRPLQNINIWVSQMTMDLFLHENLVFVFVLCLVYPMLPVSLDCLFLIAPWVFSNVYLSCVLCTLCCQCLWIVYSWLPLGFSLMFICMYCILMLYKFLNSNRRYCLIFLGWSCSRSDRQMWLFRVKTEIFKN